MSAADVVTAFEQLIFTLEKKMLTRFHKQMKNPALMLLVLQSVILLAAAIMTLLLPLQ